MPPLDVLAGREAGYGLQRVYCNAKTPYKGVTPATHGYQTDQARKRAQRTSHKNTYEPRTLIPNTLVATFGTCLKWIEKAGWFADLGTFDRHYEKVLLINIMPLSYFSASTHSFAFRYILCICNLP